MVAGTPIQFQPRLFSTFIGDRRYLPLIYASSVHRLLRFNPDSVPEPCNTLIALDIGGEIEFLLDHLLPSPMQLINERLTTSS